MLCGYLAGRLRFISREGVAALAGFVYYLATPALLIKALAESRALELADQDLVIAYFGGTLLVFFFGWLTGRSVFRLEAGAEGVMAMGSVFSNTVLLGIPIVVTAFGEAGLLHLMLIITFHSAVLMPISIGAIEWGRGAAKGMLLATWTTLRSLATNPVVLSVVIGVAWGESRLPMPGGIGAFLTLLGGAAVPCALFALGASLSQFNLGGAASQIAAVVVLKLLLHPLVVGLLAFVVLDLEPLAASVAVVTAALPSGVNVFIVAQQHGVYLARAASIVLISTLLAVPSLSALLSWLVAP